MTNLAELLSLASDIAARAGALAANYRKAGVHVAASKSSPTDIVTAADRATEEFIRAELQKARPEDGFFGEESDVQASTSGITWVVDPIDGTVNYARGLGQWGVCIAAVKSAGPADPQTWEPLVGVVAHPAGGVLYRAMRGGRAEKVAVAVDTGDDPAAAPVHYGEAEQLQLAPARELSTALIATGFTYRVDVRAQQGEQVAKLVKKIGDIRRFGAASLDLVAVAAGLMDGYFERGLQPWDHCAGLVIARAAGAVAGGVGKEREDNELTWVTTPALKDDFRALMREIGADRS